MIDIRQATTNNEFDSVRALTRAYIAWLKKELFSDSPELVDQYFESVSAELADLPGKYAPPQGQLLLAYQDGEVAGTVAMHDLGDRVCEMKRMFVHPEFHGKGIGRALATALIGEARKSGYSRMRLETSVGQVAARGLYRALGFQDIPAYYDIPESMAKNMVFMELGL